MWTSIHAQLALDHDRAFRACGGGRRRAHRAYGRAGFRQIGRRRRAHRVAGDVEDIVFMDCLATEFKRPTPAN
jgi:hypothetical protein